MAKPQSNLILLLSFLFVTLATAADPFTGRVVGVTDGDTIKVLTAAKEEIKIRLNGIDAPEGKQPYGQASKQALSDLVFSRDVMVQPMTIDRYGRTVAKVFVGDVDVCLAMVRTGFAWHYTKYSSDKTLAEAEEAARRAKKGLWKEQAVPPWEWRKR